MATPIADARWVEHGDARVARNSRSQMGDQVVVLSRCGDEDDMSHEALASLRRTIEIAKS